MSRCVKHDQNVRGPLATIDFYSMRFFEIWQFMSDGIDRRKANFLLTESARPKSGQISVICMTSGISRMCPSISCSNDQWPSISRGIASEHVYMESTIMGAC